MTFRRTYMLTRQINYFLPKIFTSCQRYVCSNADLPDQDSISGVNKLTEFFKKAERSVAEDKDSQNNSQITAHETTNGSKPSDSDPSLISNSQTERYEKNLSEEKRRVTATSFVPWTMSTLLKEMNISKLISERSKHSEKSFSTLLRYSPFIQLGDFESRELIGVVIDNVDNTDLYIDFGGKFHCVCSQPANHFYPRGSLVRIRLKNPELTDKFMINTKGISIFEADAVLLGPYKGRLVRVINEEDKVLTTTNADSVKKQRLSTDEDSVALEHWRLK
ncbi:28S ribosomal protein S28 [Schistosoma japonicum]|uniref:28S ribosomal protein S28 n=2 Tax=Schistosoma japonicum TaxID=6182 RepID=A0A4Z2CVL7_SCHJA|nr:28S ribosomal protein S28 [Schistosoma japonicum]